MIIKWQDEDGVSFFDGVAQVSKMDAEKLVKMTQVFVGDHEPGVRNFTHGRVMLLTDKGAVLDEYFLGPKPALE